jgi:hypothetical protein
VGDMGFTLSIVDIWDGQWMGCRKSFFYKPEKKLHHKATTEEEHNDSQLFLDIYLHSCLINKGKVWFLHEKFCYSHPLCLL